MLGFVDFHIFGPEPRLSMIGSMGVPFRAWSGISFTLHRAEVSDDGDENDEIVIFSGKEFLIR